MALKSSRTRAERKMLRGLIWRHIVLAKGRLGLGQERNFIVDCILAYDINNGVIVAYPTRGRPTQGAISAYPTIRSASSPGTSTIRGFLDDVLRVESTDSALNRPRKRGFCG